MNDVQEEEEEEAEEVRQHQRQTVAKTGLKRTVPCRYVIGLVKGCDSWAGNQYNVFNCHGLFFDRDADEEEEETKWNNNETANGKKRVVASVQRLAGMLLVIGLVNGSIVIVMPVANIIW